MPRWKMAIMVALAVFICFGIFLICYIRRRISDEMSLRKKA